MCDALGYCPFELYEGIKCDMLKFLKVSKKKIVYCLQIYVYLGLESPLDER